MKRQYAILVVLVMTSFLLGCGNNSAQTESSPAPEKPEITLSKPDPRPVLKTAPRQVAIDRSEVGAYLRRKTADGWACELGSDAYTRMINLAGQLVQSQKARWESRAQYGPFYLVHQVNAAGKPKRLAGMVSASNQPTFPIVTLVNEQGDGFVAPVAHYQDFGFPTHRAYNLQERRAIEQDLMALCNDQALQFGHQPMLAKGDSLAISGFVFLVSRVLDEKGVTSAPWTDTFLSAANGHLDPKTNARVYTITKIDMVRWVFFDPTEDVFYTSDTTDHFILYRPLLPDTEKQGQDKEQSPQPVSAA